VCHPLKRPKSLRPEDCTKGKLSADIYQLRDNDDVHPPGTAVGPSAHARVVRAWHADTAQWTGSKHRDVGLHPCRRRIVRHELAVLARKDEADLAVVRPAEIDDTILGVILR
jgi:hypothetical protein